jgi:SAM-dependent methyltransferase
MNDIPGFLSEGLDFAAVDVIRRAYSGEHEVKFADYAPRIRKAWRWAQELKLAQSPPLDILDIGTGPGYFVHVCRRLGHNSVGLDRPGLTVFPELRDWLGISCIEHEIRPNTPLPVPRRFDLVTSFLSPFNYLPRERRFWTLAEWTFFFDDLRQRVLKPSGRAIFQIKKGRHGEENQIQDPDFVRLCTDRGGELMRDLLVFNMMLTAGH